MNRRTDRPNPGGFVVQGNLTDVVIANGENARASHAGSASRPIADLVPIERELERLRVQIDELQATSGGAFSPEAAVRAVEEADALEHEIREETPDSDEISRRLGRLSMLLGNVVGLAETVSHLGRAVGHLVGWD